MAEAIISRRGTKGTTGIKPYVVQTKLSFLGQADNNFDSEYGVRVAYYDNGDVFISVKRTDYGGSNYGSTGVYWNLDSAPEGVSITQQANPIAPSANRSENFIFGAVVTGIASKVSVSVVLNHTSNYDSPSDGGITITEV